MFDAGPRSPVDRLSYSVFVPFPHYQDDFFQTDLRVFCAPVSFPRASWQTLTTNCRQRTYYIWCRAVNILDPHELLGKVLVATEVLPFSQLTMHVVGVHQCVMYKFCNLVSLQPRRRAYLVPTKIACGHEYRSHDAP